MSAVPASIVWITIHWWPVASAILVFVALYWWVRPSSFVFAREFYVGIDDPIPIHGFVDKINKRKGVLIVEEYKTRPKNIVYASDIWQLSFYKFILKRTQTRPVAEYGIITVHLSDGSRSKNKEHRIPLKTDTEVLQFFNRYHRIVSGAAARKAKNKIYCRRCSHHKVKCPGSDRPD